MREIVLDTETTGLDPKEGHRVVEIGAVELINHLPTGRVFHEYINPERDMPAEAEKIHGISAAFLEDKPVFAGVTDAFLAFLEHDGQGEPSPGVLVIHNAAFDIKFLNFELGRLGHPAIANDRVIDSLQLARQRFPGAPASLDALCRRFDVDSSARTKHGALLDSELLAEVYLGLIGGRQARKPACIVWCASHRLIPEIGDIRRSHQFSCRRKSMTKSRSRSIRRISVSMFIGRAVQAAST
jgi:DNA polymerase-3 subunit epsilon